MTGLKKIRDEPVKDRKQWISPSSPLPLCRQCELAGVTRSTVYAQHLPAEPDEQELTLLGEIDAEYTRFFNLLIHAISNSYALEQNHRDHLYPALRKPLKIVFGAA